VRRRGVAYSLALILLLVPLAASGAKSVRMNMKSPRLHFILNQSPMQFGAPSVDVQPVATSTTLVLPPPTVVTLRPTTNQMMYIRQALLMHQFFSGVATITARQLEQQHQAEQLEKENTTTTTVVVPYPTATQSSSDAESTDTADWQCIRIHESGDNYNNPDMPSGAYGILESTAAAYDLPWPVSSDSVASQDAVALELYNRDGWQPWSSRYACGL
jgi:hypothetical protein